MGRSSERPFLYAFFRVSAWICAPHVYMNLYDEMLSAAFGFLSYSLKYGMILHGFGSQTKTDAGAGSGPACTGRAGEKGNRGRACANSSLYTDVRERRKAGHWDIPGKTAL